MLLKNIIDNHNNAKNVMNKLLSRKISRAPPTKKIDIEEIIANAAKNNDYIELLGLWGGSKEGVPGDEADRRSIDSLNNIQKYSNNTIRISLLFCDMHHYCVNKVPWDKISSYYEKIHRLTEERNIYLMRLINEVDYGPNKKIEYNYTPNELYNYKSEDNTNNSELFDELVSIVKKHYLGNDLKKLEEEMSYYNNELKRKKDCADNKIRDSYENQCRATWFKKYNAIEIRIEQILSEYINMEIYFLRKIREKYTDIIFFSFSDPRIQRPIAEKANVPMFYFHARSEGKSFGNEVPWYSGTNDSEKQQH